MVAIPTRGAGEGVGGVSDKPQLVCILEKDGRGGFDLWGCRGEGRGCTRNKYRARKTHCEDCLLGREEETIEQFMKRLEETH